MPNFMVLPPFEREHDADLARRNGGQPAVGIGFLQVPASDIDPSAVPGYLLQGVRLSFRMIRLLRLFRLFTPMPTFDGLLVYVFACDM